MDGVRIEPGRGQVVLFASGVASGLVVLSLVIVFDIPGLFSRHDGTIGLCQSERKGSVKKITATYPAVMDTVPMSLSNLMSAAKPGLCGFSATAGPMMSLL